MQQKLTRFGLVHYLVTFCSKEESQETLMFAIKLAAATQARITLLKVIADPQAVGVVAELVATDEPFVLANDELEQIIKELMSEQLDFDSVVWKSKEAGKGIVDAAIELGADMVFVGTRDVSKPSGWWCLAAVSLNRNTFLTAALDQSQKC